MKEYPIKTLYFEDELHDDFASTKIARKSLPKKLKFYHKNIFYRFLSSVVYYVIAMPLAWLFIKIVYGVKIVGKKKWKKAHLRKQGVFVYANHTTAADALFVPILLALPKRTRIICSVEAVSNSFLRPIEMFLGALPLPDCQEQRKPFVEAVNYYAGKRNDCILIFPEAHIWPYCTRIRPFGEQAYTYPAQEGLPVVSVCATFERRRFLRFLPPRHVIHVSDAVYPEMDLPLGERSKKLRDASYEYMVEISSSLENAEYYRYLPKEKGGVSLPSSPEETYNPNRKEDA